MFNFIGRLISSFASLLISIIIIAVMFFAVLPAILFLVVVAALSSVAIWLVVALASFVRGVFK